MANIKEMAEAHLKNVQKQIQDLENGIAEINGSSNLVEQQSSPVAMELPTSNIFK